MVYRGDHPIKIGKNEKRNIAQDLKILQMRNARASSGVLLGWHKCNFLITSMTCQENTRRTPEDAIAFLIANRQVSSSRIQMRSFIGHIYFSIYKQKHSNIQRDCSSKTYIATMHLFI